MRRYAILVVALSCVLAGCAGTQGVSPTDSGQAYSTATPIDRPDFPSSLNESAAVQYAIAVERARVHNSLLSAQTTRIETDCEGTVLRESDAGYLVSSACAAAYYQKSEQGDAISVGDRGAAPSVYLIERGATRLEPTVVRGRNLDEEENLDSALDFSLARNIYIYNFDTESHSYDLSLVPADTDDVPTFTYTHSIEPESARTLVREFGRTGTYNVEVTVDSSSQAVSTANYTTSTAGVLIITDPSGNTTAQAYPD